jgi:hypothetical protein
MELSLILLIIGFLVVVFLIFKFIKKLVVAIVSVIFVFLLLVGAVVGLVYLDLNNLMENENYDIHVVYSKDNTNLLGVKVPIQNKSLNIDNIKSISQYNLDNLNTDELEKEDKKFVVIIPNSSFVKLTANQTYDISEMGIGTSQMDDFTFELTGKEVVKIIESQDSMDMFITILFEKNNIDDVAADLLKPTVEAALEGEFDKREISLKEVLFLYSASKSLESQKKLVILFEDYKDKEIEVYPDRLTFKVLKLLPIDILKDYFEQATLTN